MTSKTRSCLIHTERGDVISRIAAAGDGLECQRRSYFYIGDKKKGRNHEENRCIC